jgi:hypothetical protein
MQIYPMNTNTAVELLPIYTNEMYLPSPTEMQEANWISKPDQARVLVCVPSMSWNGAVSEFMEKMLKACSLNPSDYAVLGVPEGSLSPSFLRDVEVETLLLFGITLESSQFQLARKPYKPFRFHRFKWLLADEVSEIMTNQKLKSMLWTDGLKPLFGI